MPTIKKYVIIFIIMLIGTTSYIVFAKASQKNLRAQIESPYKWGKGTGPIQVRLTEKENKDNVITLEGQVYTKLDSVNIEWKLPTGVVLVSGQMSETAEQETDDNIITRSIKIKTVGPLTEKHHVVMSVFAEINGQRKGNTAVFNLAETAEEKEKVQLIQKRMRERGTPPTK